ncbi:MAG: DUF4352 domain-containing protein [Actinomycetota bacterium]
MAAFDRPSRRGRRWAIVAIVVLAAAAGVTTAYLRGGGEETSVDPPRFVFTDVLVECEFENVISAQERLPAEGEFCLATFNVTNESSERHALDIGCQFLIDESGASHPASAEATFIDETGRALFTEGIAAGKLLEDAAIIFDVPPGTKGSELALHTACDAPATTIAL